MVDSINILKFKKLIKWSKLIIAFPLLIILGGILFIKIVAQSSFFDILNEFLFHSHLFIILPIIFIGLCEILLIAYSLYIKKILNTKNNGMQEKIRYSQNLLAKLFIAIFAFNFFVTLYFCLRGGCNNTFSLYLIICTLAMFIGGILAWIAFKKLQIR